MGKDTRETLGLLLVAVSLGFVGWQIRQSNVQARAGAYQALGIAVAEYHQNFSPLQERLSLEALWGTNLIEQWTANDWATHSRSSLASLRIAETLYLQVEQGLLGEEAVQSLGYGPTISNWLTVSSRVCLWPFHAESVGPSLRTRIESLPTNQRAECPVDVASVLSDLKPEDSLRPTGD